MAVAENEIEGGEGGEEDNEDGMIRWRIEERGEDNSGDIMNV